MAFGSSEPKSFLLSRIMGAVIEHSLDAQVMKRCILPPALMLAEHGEAVMMHIDDHPN